MSNKKGTAKRVAELIGASGDGAVRNLKFLAFDNVDDVFQRGDGTLLHVLYHMAPLTCQKVISMNAFNRYQRRAKPSLHAQIQAFCKLGKPDRFTFFTEPEVELQKVPYLNLPVKNESDKLLCLTRTLDQFSHENGVVIHCSTERKARWLTEMLREKVRVGEIKTVGGCISFENYIMHVTDDVSNPLEKFANKHMHVAITSRTFHPTIPYCLINCDLPISSDDYIQRAGMFFFQKNIFRFFEFSVKIL